MNRKKKTDEKNNRCGTQTIETEEEDFLMDKEQLHTFISDSHGKEQYLSDICDKRR